jgi:hypothetical protein
MAPGEVQGPGNWLGMGLESLLCIGHRKPVRHLLRGLHMHLPVPMRDEQLSKLRGLGATICSSLVGATHCIVPDLVAEYEISGPNAPLRAVLQRCRAQNIVVLQFSWVEEVGIRTPTLHQQFQPLQPR